MFEKVLKRLCPCYYSRSDEGDSTTSAVPNKSSEAKDPSRSSERSTTDPTNTNSTTESSSNDRENWKGTVNLVQPQPVFAFPTELKKATKKHQKSLLKPPMYWKKTMKHLHSEGPPVFQDSKRKNHSGKKSEKKKGAAKDAALKHSETVADITSATSPSTVEVRWLKSQSMDDVSFDTTSYDRRSEDFKKNKLSSTSHEVTLIEKKRNGRGDEGQKDWNCSKCHVFCDISHGVVLFTAAYFNKKKICMINIDRLENLSKKGREGIAYYSVVKLAVLPSEKYIKCSKVLNNCSSPEVKQDFSFSVKELTGKTLRLSVFDASLQKQHEAVGHALLTLEDIRCDQPKKYRIKLYRRSQPHVCPGTLALSLEYHPEEDKFMIAVDRGKHLSLQRDKNVKLNTYIKVSLYAYGEKVKTKKSMIVLDCRDPNYNTTFTFQVRKDQIDHLSVTIAVRLKGFVNDITIGRLIFGPFFYVDDHKLTPWGKVFLRRETVTRWFRMYL